jgi:hypothetical protein
MASNRDRRKRAGDPFPASMLPDITLPDITLPDVTLPDVTLPDTLPDDMLPDITLPDVTLPDVILFDDLPWNEPEPETETGDSTMAAIVREMTREEREKAIGVSPAIAQWFQRLENLSSAERDTTVRRMAPVDREKFHRWRALSSAA